MRDTRTFVQKKEDGTFEASSQRFCAGWYDTCHGYGNSEEEAINNLIQHLSVEILMRREDLKEAFNELNKRRWQYEFENYYDKEESKMG